MQFTHMLTVICSD